MTEIKERAVKHIRHQSPGRILNFSKETNGLIINAENACARVQVFGPTIIRVQISQDGQFDNLSYTVVAAPAQEGFEIQEEKQHIVLSTKALDVHISRELLGFSFMNKQGEVINKDEEGFGISTIGNDHTVYKTIQKGERFIGLGEKTGDLDRKGSGYTNWNTDHFAYGPDSDPIYGSYPFYIGLHNQLAYGILVDNSYKSHFNFGASNHRFSSFTVEGGDMDYYFIHEESVAKILESYTTLTGRMEMPPLWSLGYQQCRYSYYPEEEVYSVARTFREKNIPADAIVLDIHYMDAYKIFSWDKQRFPDPKKMMQDLQEQGFQVVVMCDPGIKIEEDYEPYEDGLKEDVFLKYPDGTYYRGEVWPGWCHFPDFTNPKTRKWWREKLQHYVDLGVQGFWNDMNEIATWGQRLPDLMEFDFEGEGGSTKRGRNIYGLMMCRSTYEGTKKLLRGKRPFNLTRSGFCGVQRYSAVWTGDNVANDEHMLLGVRLVNSLGLTGIAFTGYDVGGFAGETSVSLFARWISIGAFSPFFRGHTMVNSRDSEPWTFGEEVEDISRNYINLRYQLLPYLYSLFHEASENGMPISRSLAIDHSFDDNVYDPGYQNQYLFGPAFLVAPVESYKDLVKVYLPQGHWFDFHTDREFSGAQEITVDCPLTHLPVFVKLGSVVPMQSVVQSTSETPEPVLHLHVYGKGDSELEYFEDDGSSFQYQQGEYYKRTLKFEAKASKLVMETVQGSMDSKFTTVKLYLHGFEELKAVKVNNLELKVAREEVVFLPAISSFDPIENPQEESGVQVQTVEFDHSAAEIQVHLAH
ncbi:MAG: glycoside hydrolase family 31 protein [Cyclobacteriaceae bacterium]|nr:glycoside hydrolase family 31 protein [Cyclobacteriaceae bacterium]